jgi:hypothetical protein
MTKKDYSGRIIFDKLTRRVFRWYLLEPEVSTKCPKGFYIEDDDSFDSGSISAGSLMGNYQK